MLPGAQAPYTRARFDAIQNLTREKWRFDNYLFLKCSGIAQNQDIQNTSVTAIALMERFETVDDLVNADLEELTAFVSETGRGRFVDPESTAKTVRATAGGQRLLPAAQDGERYRESGHVCFHCLYARFERED